MSPLPTSYAAGPGGSLGTAGRRRLLDRTAGGGNRRTQREAREMAWMGARRFSDLVAPIESDPERRSLVDALEQSAWEALAAHDLRELRRAREMTQAELARRLDRAQPAVAAMREPMTTWCPQFEQW